VKFGTKVQTWDTLPKPNFVEIAFKNLGKIYKKKLLMMAISEALSPHF